MSITPLPIGVPPYNYVGCGEPEMECGAPEAECYAFFPSPQPEKPPSPPGYIGSEGVNTPSAANMIPSKIIDKSASCARIGYRNLLISANGLTVPLSLIPNTYERWVDTSGTMTGVFQTESAGTTLEYVGIAAHNLFTAGVTEIQISTANSIGGPYTLQATITPTSNRAIMYEFTTPITNVEEVLIFIPDDGSVNREIGVVQAGQLLVMEQPIYGGLTPPDLASKTEYQSKLSDTGQFLGRDIIIKGEETQFSWRNLTTDFVYGDFAVFKEQTKRLPFFIKWRPDFYPDTVSFCHTTQDINPQNMGGGHRRMSVSMSVRGFDE